MDGNKETQLAAMAVMSLGSHLLVDPQPVDCESRESTTRDALDSRGSFEIPGGKTPFYYSPLFSRFSKNLNFFKV
jgi:hypothetical protein